MYFDYTNYGMALRKTKQYDLAIQQFKKAIKQDSTQVGFWKEISDMYNEKNDYPNAISNYEIYMKTIAEGKTTADDLSNLGKLYFFYGSSDGVDPIIKKNSLLKADSIFTKVALLDPTNYRGNYFRAKINFALDPDNGSAKPYYEQTLTLVESKADPRYNGVIIECCRFLGFYYFVKEDYTQSKVYWNKILAIEPTNEVAVKAIDGIDKTLKKGKKK